MAESAVSSLVVRLADLLCQEAAFLDEVREEVENMRKELVRMQSFLRDADKRQDEAESVRNWVSEVRDAAYDVEDIVDDYVLKFDLRKGTGMVNAVKRYASLAIDSFELHRVGSDIQTIQKRISNLRSSLQTYGIISRNEDLNSDHAGIGRQQQMPLLRRSYSHIKQDDTVGLGEDVKTLVDQVVRSDRKFVCIYGMGGLGKTTLAKKVYHDKEVRQHFDAFAWAYISEQCQIRDAWEGILVKLQCPFPSTEQRKEIQKLKDEELAKALYQVQWEKKCLVILDDIWSVETWNKLCPAFPDGRSGSKIVVTTRNRDVALHPDPTCFLLKPRFLNEDDSWELFKKKTFLETSCHDLIAREQKEKLGKEMIRRCKGLPLAIIVLGGLLATKETIYEWDDVRKNIIPHLRRGKGNQEVEGVSKVFALSYHELPYRLKPCFLHLAQFPEDSEIPVKKLIRMWIAEGFISVHEGADETMEDVAQRYINELVERCMIQVAERGCAGRIRTCRMHDLMRDFCLSKARQENFVEIFNQHSTDSNASSSVSEARSTGTLRRLVINLDKDFKKFIPSGFKRNSHLRSLVYFHVKACSAANKWRSIKDVFDRFRLLRILDLEGIQGCNGKLAKEIGNLIHLRFLSLRDTDIDELPATIGNLRYLQTLDLLTWNSTVQIPNVISKMQRLRHLYLPESCAGDSEKWKLDTLCNLQTLVNFPAEKCDPLDLVSLTKLKKLVIDDPRFSRIFWTPGVLFTHLQSLSFVSNDEASSVTRVISGCPHLYKLHIEGQIQKLPECRQFSPKLAKLNLQGSKLVEDPMPMLEKLPNLRILRLQAESFLGKDMICSSKGFPQLRSLSLHGLPELEVWRVENGAMGNLRRLEISSCTSLKMVPDGLQFILSIQETEFRSMLKAFKERLEKGGEDYHIIQHVPSIVFRYCDY